MQCAGAGALLRDGSHVPQDPGATLLTHHTPPAPAPTCVRRQCVAKLQRSLPATLATGSAYWPAVNMLNFLLVPPSGRVVCVNVAGLFWNAFLS